MSTDPATGTPAAALRDQATVGATEVRVIDAGPTQLGECPLWDPRCQRLFWIDSLACTIFSARQDGSQRLSWVLPEVIGSIGLAEDGRFVAGLEGGFALVDISGKDAVIERIGNPEPVGEGTRLNDGKVDRQGRYWCGSMNIDFSGARGRLYRLDPGLQWSVMATGITVSNGIAFSPDSKKLYFSDSRLDRSYQYDLDAESGTISHARPFVETAAYEGRIDGATVDSDGNYWGALFEGAAVACFSPEGRLLRRIPLPTLCPTMCSFGGTNMDVLYVTSATFLMSPEAIAEENGHAGALYAIHGLGATGIAEPVFRMERK